MFPDIAKLERIMLALLAVMEAQLLMACEQTKFAHFAMITTEDLPPQQIKLMAEEYSATVNRLKDQCKLIVEEAKK